MHVRARRLAAPERPIILRLRSLPEARCDAVLKLVYHTLVFGPINLDYQQPVIRVGRNDDNDLVLPHPSVEPYHCTLLFRAEQVVWLPPDYRCPPETDLNCLDGPQFGQGDALQFGELQFTLDHSAQTVALPEATLRKPDGESAAFAAGQGFAERRYVCSHCGLFWQRDQVKWMGLVGQAKHSLCPQCSYPVELEPELEQPMSGFKRWILKAGQGLTSFLRRDRPGD